MTGQRKGHNGTNAPRCHIGPCTPRGSCGAKLNLSNTVSGSLDIGPKFTPNENKVDLPKDLPVATIPKMDKFVLDKHPPGTVGRVNERRSSFVALYPIIP